MSRGRQLKTKKADWYWESKMRRKGEIQAELEMHKQKPLGESAREHIGKWLDKIDPLEAGAVMGLAMLIKPAVASIIPEIGNIAWAFTHFSEYLGSFEQPFKELAQSAQGNPPKKGDTTSGQNAFLVELTAWLVAVGIAYYVIKNGIPFSNITGLVKMFGL